jgi:putative Mg2+ transporter-C (MgtC) family protein
VDGVSVLVRLVVILLLAGALGFEREVKRRPAGLRTHMLVGVSATLLVVLSEVFVERFREYGEVIRFDPSRTMEAIVTGISFLGAGTIFVTRGRERVQGLTTAASILATSVVGIAVGLEQYLTATIATMVLLGVLAGLAWLERRVAAETGAQR